MEPGSTIEDFHLRAHDQKLNPTLRISLPKLRNSAGSPKNEDYDVSMTSIHIALLMNYGLSYCRAILHGIRRYALAKPNWVFLSTHLKVGAAKGLLRLSPDGMIAQIHNSATASALAAWHRPLVNISRTIPGLTWPRVGVDEVQIGRLVAAHLRERNLQHYAFVGYPGYEYAMKREAAFRQALATGGEPYTLDRYDTTPEMPMITKGRPWVLDRRMLRWLKVLPKPVGIFASNDICAAYLSEMCRELSLNVPREVVLVGVDNDDLLCDLARPSLSSVAIPGEQIGYEAAALLDRLIGGAPAPRKPILLPPVGIVTRESSDMSAVDDPDVAAALRFIRSNANLPLRVSDVLRVVLISRRRLEQRFRQTLQRTPADEIRRVHMERARHLLAGSDLSLEVVAQQSGFSNAKHMGAVFRHEIACTPTQYRHKHQSALRTRRNRLHRGEE